MSLYYTEYWIINAAAPRQQKLLYASDNLIVGTPKELWFHTATGHI